MLAVGGDLGMLSGASLDVTGGALSGAALLVWVWGTSAATLVAGSGCGHCRVLHCLLWVEGWLGRILGLHFLQLQGVLGLHCQ